MKHTKRLLSIAGGCAMRHPMLTAGLFFSVAGSVAFALLPPLVLERVIDGLAGGVEIGIFLALVYFASLAASGLFDALKEMLITVFGQKITHALRSEMCAKLAKLPASYFVQNEPGAVVSRFVGDVDTVETLFASGVIGMFVDACKIVSILAVVYMKSKGLGILLLIAAPLLFLFTRSVQKRMLSAQMQNRESVAKLNSFVPETIRCIRMLHVFRREKHFEEKYDAMVQESYEAVDRVNFCDAIYSPVVSVVSAVIVAIMMTLAASGGAMQSLFGMSVGTAVAVIAYVGKVFEPLQSIGMEIQTVQSAIAGVRRIYRFLEETEREKADETIFAEALAASGKSPVQLENVCFSYSDGVPVLRNVSFSVDAGEHVTIVGRTGAGKSTLFKLLLGFYAPDDGKTSVFGAPSERIPDILKRKLFGYVEQSFRPVPGSVADQISAFDASVSRAAVESAARLVGIHETIVALPAGYETLYSDGLFSQGQKQLLAIARAVVADPAILLLDEITANLDAETEERVLIALERASEKRTVLSISHRLYEHTGGRIISIESACS